MNFFPDLLSVKKKSGIKVIAGRGFRSGERVVELIGEIRDLDGSPYVTKGVIQVSPTQLMEISGIPKDIPHSCDPNCGLIYTKESRLFLTAIKTINPMEQVFWDFSTTMTCVDVDFDCECRAKTCRKKVSNYERLPEDIRRKYEYLGIVAPYLAPMTVIR